MLDEWNWTIGEIVAPFGRFGEVKVRLETDFPDRFQGLKEVCLRHTPRQARLAEVQGARLHKGQILLKIVAVDSIDDANKLRGAKVQVRRENAVPLPEGSYYATDVMGLDVVTKEGRLIGKIDNVLPYPAQDLYQVGDILIPAVRQIVKEIDIPGGRIIIDPPEGLLPDETAENAD